MIPQAFSLTQKGVLIYVFVGVLFVHGWTVGAQERIRIGISTLGPAFIPTIVAEKKGFYAKYGLASEHIIISLAIAMNALGTGELDYATTVAQGITAAARGFPVKLVMLTQDKLDFFLMARPEIGSVSDLRGKIVGISYLGSTTHLVAESILRRFGLEPGRDVSLLPSGDSPGRVVALETGRVQAAINTPPYNIVGAKKGFKILLWAKDHVAIPQNAVIVTDKRLRESRDQVKKMIKGTIEGLQFIKNRQDEAIDIAAKWMKLDRERVKAVLESVFPLYSADGAMSDEALQAALDAELRRSKIEKKVSISDVADRSLLLEAQRELSLK